MSRLRLVFGGAVFLAAFLLFLVEPIAAKQLLPILGGSAAVWITCLVFFQTALLVGYLYAHWLARRPLWMLHFLLIVFGAAAAVTWATRPFDAPDGAVHPVFTVFLVLTLSIGLPFLLLAATSPLLQRAAPHAQRPARFVVLRIRHLRTAIFVACVQGSVGGYGTRTRP